MSAEPNEPTPEPEQDWQHPQEPTGATEPPAEGEPDAVLPGEQTEPTEDEGQPVSPEQPEDGPEDPDMEPPPGTPEYEGEPPAEGEPEPEPQAAAPLTEKDLERIHVKMEKYRDDNAERIARILGGEFEHAVPCPLCSHFSPGYIGLVDVPPDAIPLMRAILGMPDLSSFVSDPHSSACPTCEGRGQTLTGSLVPEHETRTCPTCMGTGYRATNSAPANGPPDAEGEPVMTGPLHVVDEDGDPAIAALKARGFQVFPPLSMPQA